MKNTNSTANIEQARAAIKARTNFNNGRTEWYLPNGKRTNKKVAADILNQFGFTLDSYLFAEEKYINAKIAEGAKKMAIEDQADFLKDKIARESKSYDDDNVFALVPELDELNDVEIETADDTSYYVVISMFGNKTPMFSVTVNGKAITNKRGGSNLRKKEVDEWILQVHENRSQYSNMTITVSEEVATLHLDSFACNPRFIHELNVTLTGMTDNERRAIAEYEEFYRPDLETIIDDYAITSDALKVAIDAEIALAINSKSIKKMIITTKENANGKITAYYLDGIKTCKGYIEWLASSPAYNGVIEIDYYTAKYSFPKIFNDDYLSVVYKDWGFTGREVATKPAADKLGLKLGKRISPYLKIYHVLKDEVEDKSDLPTGNITVSNGIDAFNLVGKYFPNGLNFVGNSKGFNREDEFTFNDGSDLFVTAFCSKDNSRVEALFVIDTNEAGSKRRLLNVYIKKIEIVTAETDGSEEDDDDHDFIAVIPQDDDTDDFNPEADIIPFNPAFDNLYRSPININCSSISRNFCGDVLNFYGKELVSIYSPKLNVKLTFNRGRKTFYHFDERISKEKFFELVAAFDKTEIQKKDFDAFTEQFPLGEKNAFFRVNIYPIFANGEVGYFARNFDFFNQAVAFVDKFNSCGSDFRAIIKRNSLGAGHTFCRYQEDGGIIREVPDTSFFKAYSANQIQARIAEINQVVEDNSAAIAQFAGNSDIIFSINRANCELSETKDFYEFILHESEPVVVDFNQKLAELKALAEEKALAKKIAEDHLEQAQMAFDNADKDWSNAAAAVNNLCKDKAAELQQSLIDDSLNANIEINSQGGGWLSKLSNFDLWIDFGYGSFRIVADKKAGLISNVLGEYNLPEQVTTVINKLKAAIARGDSEFTFPTVDELNQPPALPPVDKNSIDDSLIRAMDLALLKCQEFCRDLNISAAQNELKLFAICRQALSVQAVNDSDSITTAVAVNSAEDENISEETVQQQCDCINQHAPADWQITFNGKTFPVKFKNKIVTTLDSLATAKLLPPDKFFAQFKPLVNKSYSIKQQFLDDRYRELDTLIQMREEISDDAERLKTLDELIEITKRAIAETEFCAPSNKRHDAVDLDANGNITDIWF